MEKLRYLSLKDIDTPILLFYSQALPEI